MQQVYEIQPLLWPKPGICTEEQLYYRKNEKSAGVLGTECLTCQSGAGLGFDTYFNGFSVEKWKKYTRLSRLYLKIRLRGTFQVYLLGYRYRNAAVIPTVLKSELLCADHDSEFVLEYPEQDSIVCSFSLQAMSDGSAFLGGAYCCREEEKVLSEINLALNICTYRREKFVQTTLENLKQKILQNPDAVLHDHLHVYITDNAQTLCTEKIETDKIHLRTQNSFGSAGGFAGGQLSILRDRDKFHLTHMIFMDDDIVFEPAVLERTYWFLRLLKTEYQEYVLGSGLLRLHAPSIQVEAGAQWLSGRILSTKPNLDLNRLDHLLFNELEEGCNYQGWWYCCVPLSGGQGLPCPVYFHRDDVEFGLRQKGFLHLNGICVWHEEFENKPFSRNEYYDARNKLIVNAIHCPHYNKAMVAKELIRDVLKKLIAYRYREAKLILTGVRDFCRGAEWVIAHDCGEYHDALVQQGYHASPAAQYGKNLDLMEHEQNLSVSAPCGKLKKAMRCILGFLLPANHNTTVPMFMPQLKCFYRVKKAICYNAATETAYVVEKSMRETRCVLKELIGTVGCVMQKFDTTAAQWREHAPYYATAEFWTDHIHFEQGDIE